MTSITFLKIENCKKKGIDWLLKSGIRESDGGYKSIFAPEKREYYCWGEGTTCILCTAGAILALLSSEKHLDRAVESAEHICSLMVTDRGALDGALLAGRGSDAIYSYYSAFAIKALSELYKVTQVEEYLRVANVAGRWLITYMQNRDGSFNHVKYVRYKNFKQRFENRFHLWEGIIGPILLELHEITNFSPYKIAAGKLTNWLLKNRRDDGSFDCYKLPVINRILLSIYHLSFKELMDGCLKTHPMSQMGPLEAFLATGLEGEALKVYSWLKDRLSQNGLFYQFYYKNGMHSLEEDLMPTAYFGLSLLKNWRTDFSVKLIHRIAFGVVHAQVESNDIHINGGFMGLPGHPTLGKSLHSWDTQFSILFLNEYLKKFR